MEESLFQERWSRRISSNKEEEGKASDDELAKAEDPISHRQDIRAHNADYIKSIDFKKGSEV